MNYLPFILGSISLVGLLGILAAFFKRGGDKEASALDQNTIRAYRDSEGVLKAQITSLKAELLAKDSVIQTKDDIIERLISDGKSRTR